MKKVICITLLGVFVIGLSSCGGSSGKRAATEVIESIEKEAGSLERNVGRMERSTKNANKASKSRRRHNRGDNCYEETETTPQPVTVPCPHCQGNGMVYATDMYGNLIYDYYGNPQVVYCPQCGGKGVVVTYQ